MIVNEAGNWIGKIFGGPEGSNLAGSIGTEFMVDESGAITAVNSGNGAGSTNNSNINSESNSTTYQANTANINNNINLTANTGGNKASQNTGGNSQIKTGDAQVIASLVNFVNNNISGSSKLVVSVVNVFGSWLGDFITPGSTKTEDTQANNASDNQERAIGGVSSTDSEGSDNHQQTANSNQENSPSNNSSNQQPEGGSQEKVNTFSDHSLELKVAGISSTRIPKIAQSPEDMEPAVLGSATTAASRALNINLAWFLLILPAIASYLLYKRKLIAKILTKNHK